MSRYMAKYLFLQWLHRDIGLVVQQIDSESAKVLDVPIKELKTLSCCDLSRVHINVKLI